MWASEKFVADNDEAVEAWIWFEWFDEWVDKPWICGDETGEGEEDNDKLLESDIAEPGKWCDIGPEDETPVDEDDVNEDDPWAWFEEGAALNNWFEYNWSTVAECIGNTASMSHYLLSFV